MSNIEFLRKKYISLYGNEMVNEESLNNIERILGVVLPGDFKEISKFYSGGGLGGISHYDINYPSSLDSIVSKTLEFRKKIQLNNKYIVLAELPESVILLDTDTIPNVIWVSSSDINNINRNSADCWNNYCDFFEYLLIEEIDS